MIKLMARVTNVLGPGIHKIGGTQMPLPSRVEIELENGREGPCTMYRYTDAGDFCGDTWHETQEEAFRQAQFEYGLSARDFIEISE